MIITALFLSAAGVSFIGAMVAITVMGICDDKLSRQAYRRLARAIMLLFLSLLWSLILAAISWIIFKSF